MHRFRYSILLLLLYRLHSIPLPLPRRFLFSLRVDFSRRLRCLFGFPIQDPPVVGRSVGVEAELAVGNLKRTSSERTAWMVEALRVDSLPSNPFL